MINKLLSSKKLLISDDQGLLVFTEVKSRSTPYFGQPESAISLDKISHITVVADYFIRRSKYNAFRFDVIAVIRDQSGYRLRHFPDAFVPGILT